MPGTAGAGTVATLGETMALVRATESGSLAHAHELRLGVGGAESNVAIGLARLGVPATWLGRVGDDGFGRRVIREIRAEGVHVEGVIDPAAPTGLMVKETPLPSTTAVHYYRSGSAGSRLSPDDVDRLDFSSVSLLHVTGITLAVSASARDAVLVAVERASRAGVPVSFDVNHRSRLWTDVAYVDLYRDVARRATIVFGGVDEAAILAPSASPDDPRALAAEIAELGPTSVVIKRGDQGAAALDDGAWNEEPAVPIDPVDTVGAGDAFVAGWLAEWHAGAAPRDRLATAVRSGAFACLNAGDWEGLPFREDLAALETGGDPVAR